MSSTLAPPRTTVTSADRPASARHANLPCYPLPSQTRTLKKDGGGGMHKRYEQCTHAIDCVEASLSV